ncbi:MAG: hypothetical protein KF729_00270 [Sandaracinaceae bacterium]|nr:hypothetical protein [Sandaracinaceae bacterium]
MPAARLAFLVTLLLASTAAAQARRVEVRFTPTARAQLAVWIESADEERFATLRLTQSVSYYGIGNRPGALQMNSGFRWPFGRREGTLPIWAHRRLAHQGVAFPRVIFNGRSSEGAASVSGGEPGNTRDDYFCLSFQRERSGREALDAVTCASTFNSNKGRYATADDVARGYGEPFEATPGAGSMRLLGETSLYPPRRDVPPCSAGGCNDHETVGRYAADARAVMPEIDAVTMATPAGDVEQRIVWDVPAGWPDGDYVVYVEVNVEGDYNAVYNDATLPTPQSPSGLWDYWAINYGYAYRGQPSIVYRVPFRVASTGGSASTATVAGFGAMHGEDGELRAMDGTIVDDPAGAPGSGADRLRRSPTGARVAVEVPMWDLCSQPVPPVECGWECEPGDGRCGRDLICGPENTCVGICDVPMTPAPVADLRVWPHEEQSRSHQWARFSFRVPELARGLTRYEVRVGTHPIVDEASFERALPAREAAIDSIELRVPTDAAPGALVELALGGLTPQQHYWIGVRAVDGCNVRSPIAVGEVETTPIHFTTVSPCFVATAAYGSPLAAEIGALRRLRDRHLASNAPGRALVGAYYAVGPHLARAIARDESLRGTARAALAPLVALARWLGE